MKTMAIRLDETLHAQLVVLAELSGRPIAEEVREAITAHLARARSETDLTAHAEQALARIEQEAATRTEAIKSLLGNRPSPSDKSEAKSRKKTGEPDA